LLNDKDGDNPEHTQSDGNVVNDQKGDKDGTGKKEVNYFGHDGSQNQDDAGEINLGNQRTTGDQ